MTTAMQKDREATRPICRTCGRLVSPGKESITFKSFHAKCIARAVDMARADQGGEGRL
jgi:hypothetical protein